MDENLSILLVEIDPDLHPVEGLGVLRGDEAETVDVLRKIEIFAQQVKHQVRVDLVLVGLLLAHWEHESSTYSVTRVFPLGLNALLEVL